MEAIAEDQSPYIDELQESIHASDHAAHYAEQIYLGELCDAESTQTSLVSDIAFQRDLSDELDTQHAALRASYAGITTYVDSLRPQVAHLEELVAIEHTALTGQVSQEHQQQHDELVLRQGALATLRGDHHTLQTLHDQVVADNTSLATTLETLRTHLASSLDAARTEIANKQRDRQTSRLRISTDVDKQRHENEELATACGILEVDNVSQAQQLAESQQEVSELKIWHQELETKREKDQLDYDAQCTEMFRQIAASEDARKAAEERARDAEKAAKAAVAGLKTSQDAFVAELAAVRSHNVTLKSRNDELTTEHKRLQEMLLARQMAHYTLVDDLSARIRDLQAKEQPPLATPATRQRQSQIASLEDTIELLKLTDCGMKQMLEEEIQSRKDAGEKLSAILATVKYIDSPSLHDSPAALFEDLSSVRSDTPSLVDSPGSFSRSFSLTPEPETPGLLLFDADDLAASGSCDIVESVTATHLAAGLGLGFDLGM